MPGPKKGEPKASTSAKVSSAMESMIQDDMEGNVSYVQSSEDIIMEQELGGGEDPLLQGVVLSSSAEGEVITGDMDEAIAEEVVEPATSSQPTQPTYVLVQQSGSQVASSSIMTEARTADGNIVQLRQITSAGTIQSVPSIRPAQQIAVKRAAQGSSQPTVTKVIIQGGSSSGTQQVVLGPGSGGASQTIKLVASSAGSTMSTQTRTITLAQAQQMGLLGTSATKMQIAPASSAKQNIVLSKVVGSGKASGSGPKITMLPQGMKSPTKILPAPSGLMKPAVASVAQVNTGMGNVKLVSGQQKIIIRPTGTQIKSGTVLAGSSGGGQIIRIPATQNILGAVDSHPTMQTVQLTQGGKQVQYLKLVQTPQGMMATSPKVSIASPVKQTIAPAPVKMVPIAPATSVTPARAVGPKQITPKVMLQAGPSTSTSQQVRQLAQVAQMGQVTSTAVTQLGGALVPTAGGNFMVLPAQVYDQLQAVPRTPPVEILKLKERTTPRLVDTTPRSAVKTTPDTNGIRPRKPCNCTKSQCLKLYCDCFANGEFCNNCNCNTCYNNLEHEEERQKAIRACLERNPQAFKPKIGKTQVGDERRHNKGCNCRRSGCLKNYCECYEAKIPCTNMCKCIGCRNLEDNEERKLDRENVVMAAGLRARQQHMYAANRSRFGTGKRGRGATATVQMATFRQPFSFLNQRLVEATCECLLAQARAGEQAARGEPEDEEEEEEGERGPRAQPDEAEIERRVLEEYGACLRQFIECSTKLEHGI